MPSEGYLLEAAMRGSQRGMGSSYSYVGGTARAMGFVPIGSRVVLAARVVGDALTGGTPLFELARFGGVDPLEGVGGERSVRGIPKARFIGRVKALGTVETRVRLADARVLDRRVSFGAVAFFDTGRVWQLQGNDGQFFDFHSGAGGGLRGFFATSPPIGQPLAFGALDRLLNAGRIVVTEPAPFPANQANQGRIEGQRIVGMT